MKLHENMFPRSDAKKGTYDIMERIAARNGYHIAYNMASFLNYSGYDIGELGCIAITETCSRIRLWNSTWAYQTENGKLLGNNIGSRHFEFFHDLIYYSLSFL